MEYFFGVFGTLIVFGAIIFFHELGHFIVAKISRMAVFEFSLGFGPALVSKTYHDTLYAIRVVPLGGYVRIAGMEPGEDPNVANGFNSKPFIAKFATILAGVVMNGVLALVVFIVLGMAVGYPLPGNKTLVDGVMPNTPAANAGLKAGDTIAELDGVPYPSVERTIDRIRNGPVPAHFVVERDGKLVTLNIRQTQVATYERKGLLYGKVNYRGIGFAPMPSSGTWKRLGLGESIVNGARDVEFRLVDTFAQFLSMVLGRISPGGISGPIGIMHQTYNIAKDSFSSLRAFGNVLNLIAIISVAIGFFNLLPIPALDGSRLFFLVVDGVMSLFGRRIDPQKEAMVHMVGLMVLLSLIAVITIKDIGQWVGWWKIKM